MCERNRGDVFRVGIRACGPGNLKKKEEGKGKEKILMKVDAIRFPAPSLLVSHPLLPIFLPSASSIDILVNIVQHQERLPAGEFAEGCSGRTNDAYNAIIVVIIPSFVIHFLYSLYIFIYCCIIFYILIHFYILYIFMFFFFFRMKERIHFNE